MKVTKAMILSLLFPILALAGLTLYHQVRQGQGIVWEIPITGYDPVHPLQGRYLQFTFSWNWNEAHNARFNQWQLKTSTQREIPLLYLNDLGGGKHEAYLIDPSWPEAQTFGRIIKGQWYPYNKNFVTGKEKYYVDESMAPLLEKILRQRTYKSTMKIRVTPGGQIYLLELLLDGRPWASVLSEF
jgi:hypothetical protein